MDFFDPASTTTAAVFSCSPRAGGNSDHAAQYVASGIQDAGGETRIINLRQFRIMHCLGCGRCQYDPNGNCFQSQDDQSGPLFQVLLSAPLVIFCSPIYFYHLPSGFKTLIDRSQSYYLRMLDNDPELTGLPQRPAGACFVAGRPKGERTFQGALLTMRYFLEPFRLSLLKPVTLRGLDGPNDLKERPELVEMLRNYGREAWEKALEHGGAGQKP